MINKQVWITESCIFRDCPVPIIIILFSLSRENMFVNHYDVVVCVYWSTGQKKYLLFFNHYDDGIMGAIASQITSLTIVYSTDYSGADQSKHQSSASLAFVWGIHRGPVNSPHKWPVTRKMFPFDDVMVLISWYHDDWIKHHGTKRTKKIDFLSVYYILLQYWFLTIAIYPIHVQ